MASNPENWNPFPDSLDSAVIANEFERSWKAPAVDDSPPSSGHTCHWLYKKS